MAITDRAGTSKSSGSKQATLRPPVSAMDAIDDLYENNAFGDEDEDIDAVMPVAVGRRQQSASPADAKESKAYSGGNNANSTNGVQFDVWVARKDKYERMTQALAKLNVERAADDDRWLDVAVSLAATDCALKTGRSERCDCPGVCRNAAHAVTRQRTRCQCPAKKCSLCGRCVNTTPGQITSKMADALAPFRSGSTASLGSNLLPSAVMALADQVASAGEGKCLAPGALKISRAAVRMAQTVLAQCSVVESGDGGSGRAQRPCSCPLRSLGELWVKWTTRYHTFSRVPLTEKEASQFAVGTRQMMEHDTAEPDRFFMTLKWHQAAKPQKGDTAKIAARRALTPDQKKQNALFLTLCKRHWKQAQHRVVEYLQAKLAELDKLPHDKKKQLTAVLASSIPSGSSLSSYSSEALAAAALELQALNKLGVKRMLQWVEEDEEAVETQKRDEQKEKAEGGIAAHSAWVRKKDRLRIRMPPPTREEKTASARFDFSSKGAVRRKDFKAPSTTVELMKNSGLKYVHAMNDGFQGRGGDLEKCKQLLVKQGYVLRANFSDSGGGGYDDGDDAGFSKDRYQFERANNPTRKKRREGDKARRQQSQASFAAWTAHKALRDKALKFLDHLPRPSEDDDEPQEDGDAQDTAMTRWEQVGRALKAVDRTLLEAWVRWTGEFRSVSTCRALWESFPPVACDVHCPSSALRDVFLKLLHRRGVNYRQAFVDHCERKYKRAIARRDNGDDNDESDPVPDDLDEQQQMERYAIMTRREFARFLAAQGILVQPEETQRLVEYFNDEEDGGGDGQEERVSIPKFLAVVGDERRVQCHGDTDLLLRHVCMWETVCHECGMLRAFQLVVSNTSSAIGGGGGSRLRAELPGHAKRRAQGGGRFTCSPECDLRAVKKTAPAPCPFSRWSDEKALPFLKKLELWSAAPREQRVLQQLVTNGQPPDASPLYRVDDDDEEVNGNKEDSEPAVDATTMLLLRWTPPRVTGNNGAAFYQLETAGAEGTSSFRKNEYREICRDPRDFSDNGGKPRYQFLVADLAPNTKYAFRVRALNGFGAGPYTFAYFVTAPAAPPAPVAVKVSASSIALAWDTSRSYQRQLRELRRAFDAADADGDGVISRDEFMDQLERRQPRLLEFLQRVTIANGSRAGGSGPALSVFDAIETDDSESLSWSEFLGFFHGVLSVDEADNGDNNSDDDDVGGGGRLSRTSSRSQLLGVSSLSRTGGATAWRRVEPPQSVVTSRFVLKQCTDEANGEYVEIYRGTTPSFVVHGLASGSTFQFRVQAENEEGRRSLHSPPTVVNTLLPTPAAPIEIGASSTAVKLKWSVATARPSVAYETLQQRIGGSVMTVKRQNGGSVSNGVSGGAVAPKQSDEISRLLKEWAQETSFDNGSVDFRARFDRFDVDKSGYIELPEFRSLLAELGVAPSAERLAAYLAEFDTDSDGRISFSEFARWWNRADDVQYVLKRDRGQRDDASDQEACSPPPPSSSPYSSSEMAIVSYRGKDTSAVVAGLEANTLYRFRLRVVAAHASSQLSDALELWTAPAAPSRPGRVSVSCTSALLRWHSGARGAYKFVLECKLIETLPSSSGSNDISTGAGRSAAVNSGRWTRVYDGSEPLATVNELLPRTVYRVRVVALNRVGSASDQSTVTQICTPSSREEERASGGGPLRASNAAEHFTIECADVGDLVRGDAVLFCERLYQNNGVDSRGGQAGRSLATSSVYSVASTAGASSAMVAIGERTVAARVVGAKTDDKHGRVLSMVVLWSTAQLYDDPTTTVNDKRVSTRSNYSGTSKRAALTGNVRDSKSSPSILLAAGHALAADLKISRREKSLYRFDTFRKEWQDERARVASAWDQ